MEDLDPHFKTTKNDSFLLLVINQQVFYFSMANLNDTEFMSGPMPQDKKKVSFFVSRAAKWFRRVQWIIMSHGREKKVPLLRNRPIFCPGYKKFF